MGWVTIYIHGKAGCGPEILRHVKQSEINFMPGLVAAEENIGLYWVDENVSIRDFKVAIGSKTVFKYRLRVFASLERLNDFLAEKSNDSFTPQEEAMIRTMSL